MVDMTPAIELGPRPHFIVINHDRIDLVIATLLEILIVGAITGIALLILVIVLHPTHDMSVNLLKMTVATLVETLVHTVDTTPLGVVLTVLHLPVVCLFQILPVPELVLTAMVTRETRQC